MAATEEDVDWTRCKTERPRKSPRDLWAWLAVGVLAFVAFIPCLGSYKSLGSHEVLAAVPGRQMLESGDWVVPQYGDLPRFQKPPLVYWLIASSSWLFGNSDEFAVRFHSAVAGLGLVVLMAIWAGRWYGRTAGFCAALVQATSVWAILFGRQALVDVVMCLVTATVLFLIATQPATESPARSRWRWTAILSLLGVSWLAKFHYGPAMILGPVGAFWLVQRTLGRWRQIVNPLGVLVLLACVFVWPTLVLREHPQALLVWYLETVGRETGGIPGSGGWWFYWPVLAYVALPWTFHFIAAVPSSWRRAWSGGDERERFLWIWLLVDMALLTVAKNKHTNYLLCVLPVVTLLSCQTMARGLARIHRGQWTMPRYVPQAVSVLLALIGIGFSWIVAGRWPELRDASLVAGGLFSLSSIATGWLIGRERWREAGWLSCGMAGCLLLITMKFVSPVFDGRLGNAEFAKRLRQEVLKDSTVYVHSNNGISGFHESVYYLKPPVVQVNSFNELMSLVSAKQELFVVVERHSLPRFDQAYRVLSWSIVAEMKPPRRRYDQDLVCLRLRHQKNHGDPAIATRDEVKSENR